MLLRISLIVAIIAGLAVGTLNFVKVKEKITTLQENLKTETAAHQKFESDYKRTKNDLDKTNAVLKATIATLEATTQERDTAVATAAAATTRADKLNTDLNKTRQERDDAQSELAAYKGTGYKPQDIVAFGKRLKSLQDNLSGAQEENKIISKRLDKVTAELNFVKHPDTAVKLPLTAQGKVIGYDPKWQFVVINIGEDQGVVEHGQLLINRNGKLVAKVIVSSVQKNRCVANVMPGWQLGEVLEGDMVIPAYPES